MGPTEYPGCGVADYVRDAITEPWVDNVARWQKMQAGDYPEAAYTCKDGWFTGALRDADDVLRSRTLGELIGRLLAREADPGFADEVRRRSQR